ncbi:site-specific integrase [Sulfurospirillum sp. hDNRA2]|uniref:site-specific integrase n=1 Tax=Sulfurospirillum sp. hDNRA2 TaxID=3237298 RepID=UPI0020B88DCC|nr:site-specific integrase [Sulfurospirillum sp. DNRA8]MCR1811771.1 site-specific integrase [Sulfurospirillum sp. DNRA8]
MRYLYFQKNRYFFKRKLPFTADNIVISLQTDSLSVAKTLLAMITPKIHKLFIYLKGNPMYSENVKKLIETYIKEAIVEYSELENARHTAFNFMDEEGKKFGGHSEKAIDRALEYIIEILQRPEDDTELHSFAQSILERSNIKSSDLTNLTEQERKDFIFEIIKAEFNVLNYDKERNQKRLNEYQNFNVTPSLSSIVTPPQDTLRQVPEKNYFAKTAKKCLEEFVTLKTLKNKEFFRNQRDIEIFLELTDKEYLIEITHDDLNTFLEDFRYLPPKEKEYIALYKKIPLKIIAARSKEEHFRTLSPKSFSMKLSNINAFLDYAISSELLDINRLKTKVKLTKPNPAHDKQNDIRKEYTNEQLEKLFNESSAYTKDFEKNLSTRPSRIWIPLILLYHGFRINEIAQIRLDQITERQNIPIFKISSEYADQKLKNNSSERKVPIHPKLIEYGFLKFVENQRQKKYERLFQDLYHTKRKGYGQAFSKFFNKKPFKQEWLSAETLEKMEAEVIMLDLHSFRHNFSSSLKGKVEDSVLDECMGHESPKGYKYGKISLETLLEGISKCSYNLNISELENKLKNHYFKF